MYEQMSFELQPELYALKQWELDQKWKRTRLIHEARLLAGNERRSLWARLTAALRPIKQADAEPVKVQPAAPAGDAPVEHAPAADSWTHSRGSLRRTDDHRHTPARR